MSLPPAGGGRLRVGCLDAPGGQRHRHGARHRRIADAIGLAALEGRDDSDVGRVGAGPHQRQRHVDLVEIHGDVAEMRVVVRLAGRPARRAGADAVGAGDAEFVAVLVEVVTAGRGEAQQHGVAVPRDRFEAEGLLRRQRVANTEQRRRCTRRTRRAAERAAERGETAVGGAGRWRQRDLQRARLRRIADAQIRAALVLDLQRDTADPIRGLPGQRGDERAAIGLDIAEELVVMLAAVGQLQGRRAEIAGRHPCRGAVPVEVVAVGDPPADLDPVPAHRLCGDRQRLVDRQHIVEIDRQRRRRGEQQQGQGDQAATAMQQAGASKRAMRRTGTVGLESRDGRGCAGRERRCHRPSIAGRFRRRGLPGPRDSGPAQPFAVGGAWTRAAPCRHTTNGASRSCRARRPVNY